MAWARGGFEWHKAQIDRELDDRSDLAKTDPVSKLDGENLRECPRAPDVWYTLMLWLFIATGVLFFLSAWWLEPKVSQGVVPVSSTDLASLPHKLPPGNPQPP